MFVTITHFRCAIFFAYFANFAYFTIHAGIFCSVLSLPRYYCKFSPHVNIHFTVYGLIDPILAPEVWSRGNEFINFGRWLHGHRNHAFICDGSAENAYSSMAPDRTSYFCRGPCLLYSCFVFLLWTFDFEHWLLSPYFIEFFPT